MSGLRSLSVFARPIVAGAVKTRLAGSIGPGAAATLYEAFVRDTLAVVEDVPGVSATLWVAGDPDHPTLRDLWPRRRPQPDVDLGRRMSHALGQGLAAGGTAVVIGTDAPTLPPGILEAAFAALEASPAPRAVVGPAADGGYTLLGVGRPIPEGTLDGVRWSSPGTLAETEARMIPTHGLPARLPPWYDVDDGDDLRLLAAHLAASPPTVAPATRRALADLAHS